MFVLRQLTFASNTMKVCFISILLSVLLLAQAGRTSVMLHWQQMARESFTELFCVNKAWEDAPMCFGSCQRDALLQEMGTDKSGDQITSTSLPTTSPYCQMPTRTSLIIPVIPRVVIATKPALVPLFAPREHTGFVFEPPRLG